MTGLLAFSAAAALDQPTGGFSAGTTNGATTLSYAVVSARSVNGGTPAVQYINAQSDLAASTVRFGKVIAEATATTNSTTRIDVLSTNTGVNWQSGTIIVRHMVDDSYEKLTLTSNTGSTNVVTTVAPRGAVYSGDKLYYVTTNAATILWGATSNSVSAAGAPLFVGQQGKPLLVEVNGTSLATLNVASGIYLPKQTP